MKRESDEDVVHDEHVQRLADAYRDGRDVARSGGAAGLCPQWLSYAEQREWMRGHTAEQGAQLARRAA